MKRWGPAAILSDGDVVFQPRKVDRSGLYEAVDGNVLIYVHKEQELDRVEARFPAVHYVMVDDKLRILAAIKEIWGPRVTTLFVRQGHYPGSGHPGLLPCRGPDHRADWRAAGPGSEGGFPGRSEGCRPGMSASGKRPVHLNRAPGASR